MECWHTVFEEEDFPGIHLIPHWGKAAMQALGQDINRAVAVHFPQAG